MESHPVERFDIASGAPFNALQARLGLIRDGHHNVLRKVVFFVLSAWGVPLILCGIGGPGAGLDAMLGYLAELPVWARYVLAISLLVSMDKQAGMQLRGLQKQFTCAPLLSKSSLSASNDAVKHAARRCDSHWAELICLLAAAGMSWLLYTRLMAVGDYSWVKQPGETGAYMTAAGWWIVAVSNTLLGFLVFRWIWRFIVWCGLLRSIARMEMRLVSTHPDGRAGLGFVGAYPNAFKLFVLALACVIGAVLANLLNQNSLDAALYGYVMALWLALVLVAFCVPLLPFNKPLARLKRDTTVRYNAIATQHFRDAERSVLGENIAAADEDPGESPNTPDPSKTMLLVDKQSVTLINLKALVPIQLAALLPLAAAGLTLLPLKEILALLKKILLI